MDVLTDILTALELRGWLSSRTEMTRSWRFEFEASPDITFHILKFGSGYVWVEGEETPIKVGDGDVVVFPHGHGHTIADASTSPLIQKVLLDYRAHGEYQLFPGELNDPETMVMLCGAFHLDNQNIYPLLNGLPNIIHIPGKDGAMNGIFPEVVNLITQETVQRQTGSEVMLRRLTEMLFIQVIRIWLEQSGPNTGGRLNALCDPSISAALGLIHQQPGRAWKVEELANEVALSRSEFSARFTRLVGEPPLKYLTRWRMQRASKMLKNGIGLGVIAENMGYESEAAFRKAFRREVGLPPALYRKGIAS